VSKQPIFLLPDWPAPESVRAAVTTRQSGASSAPYDSFNLGDHVGDKSRHVAQNRQQLITALQLPGSPLWLQQVHSTTVWQAEADSTQRVADAIIARSRQTVCAILSADCLPLLLCSQDGDEVAAIHVGWRGLAQGIIQNTIRQLKTPAGQMMVWMGPAIGPAAYEVDQPVHERFVHHNSALASCFTRSRAGHWQMDIYAIARQILGSLGVTHIYGGEHCTYSDSDLFFSHRRDGTTGRMASLIWIS
jgi:hypothetical protein